MRHLNGGGNDDVDEHRRVRRNEAVESDTTTLHETVPTKPRP